MRKNGLMVTNEYDYRNTGKVLLTLIISAVVGVTVRRMFSPALR